MTFFVSADAKLRCGEERQNETGVGVGGLLFVQESNSFEISAYLSSYAKQHLNYNECLRVALKEMSCSANSPFKMLLLHCRFPLFLSM